MQTILSYVYLLRMLEFEWNMLQISYWGRNVVMAYILGSPLCVFFM